MRTVRRSTARARVQTQARAARASAHFYLYRARRSLPSLVPPLGVSTNRSRRRIEGSRGVVSVNRSKSLFHVVGIGASAGGIEALQQFFRPLAPDSGQAFVVVTHLPPGR